jgi:hypothetical protein
MRIPLGEYRILEDWYINTTRKGVFSFGFPKINDNTGEITEYRFAPESRIVVSNPGGLIVEVSMEWVEV